MRQLISTAASPTTLGTFWPMSMSIAPSPSRSPKRTLRPAPNFGVANFFHSLGRGLAACRRLSSSLAFLNAGGNLLVGLRRDADAKVLEARRRVGREADLAAGQLVVAWR